MGGVVVDLLPWLRLLRSAGGAVAHTPSKKGKVSSTTSSEHVFSFEALLVVALKIVMALHGRALSAEDVSALLPST
jgi:hypothetical protein